MTLKQRAVTYGATGVLMSGLLGAAGHANAAEDAATHNTVRAIGVTVRGHVPGSLRQGQGSPFEAENHEIYWHPNNVRYAFMVQYQQSPMYQPGFYLYNAAMKKWYQRASLDQLPNEWVRVTDSDGIEWPLAVYRQPSGTVIANWL